MNKLSVTKIDDYWIGTLAPMSESQFRELQPLLKPSDNSQKTILGGRRKAARGDIRGLGHIAVKAYARGGLLGKVIRETYVKISDTRCMAEFKWLTTAKDIDLLAPEPIAGIWKGNLFYKCWLVMKDIGPHDTLANISLTDENRSRLLMNELQEKVSLLVQNKIHHVDLHPGNILIDKDNQIYLIDFDKAKYYFGSQKNLKAKYENRWKRAVYKHHLPLSISALCLNTP